MQVYVIVWQQSGTFKNVLVAMKKVRGARFGGQAINQPRILNYAGQWVFPGGRVENNQTPEQAAYREFFQETGIRLGWDVVTTQFNSFGEYGILYVQSVNIHLMAVRINDNLASDNTLDDELQHVVVLQASHVYALFTTWIQQSPDVEAVIRVRNRSWLTDALNRLG